METAATTNQEEGGKKLYSYQEEDLKLIFDRFQSREKNHRLLYQLPTGGGKTVVFSEIARKFINEHKKKVLILTHRIELSKQTSNVLTSFGVNNKVIVSQVKELPDQHEYMCFVAMVETLNNRLNDEKFKMDDIGLVIIDEAHYNSFHKLFKFFKGCFMLGVTATPLSSNIKLPMKNSYSELITGRGIQFLIENKFLAKANTYSYDVGLSTLKIGINGDYTVKSSEELYSNSVMQGKLLYAYEQRAKNKKTLIFNNGINTSKQVYESFKFAGYDIRHLDNSHSKQQRKDILEWFRTKPNAILTSVSILTTGFDEPTINTIIINRATRSFTLYLQMIGRGSRYLPNKPLFDVIDLGNNAARFGLWADPVDWQKIFINPDLFLESIRTDEEIEKSFVYHMPDELKALFSKTKELTFDINTAYEEATAEGKRSSDVIAASIEQHAEMIVENSESFPEALAKLRLLEHDIIDRVRRYCYCISNSTRNYRDWVLDDYKKKLKVRITQLM